MPRLAVAAPGPTLAVSGPALAVPVLALAMPRPPLAMPGLTLTFPISGFAYGDPDPHADISGLAGSLSPLAATAVSFVTLELPLALGRTPLERRPERFADRKGGSDPENASRASREAPSAAGRSSAVIRGPSFAAARP